MFGCPDHNSVENYFNYFTEIEEQFQQCRGTPVLVSTLDWALMESWKEAQWPLPAVLLGIQRAFNKHNARPRRGRKINSLAYCAQAVTEAVEDFQRQDIPSKYSPAVQADSEAFSRQEISDYLAGCSRALRHAMDSARQNEKNDLGAALESVQRTLERLGVAHQNGEMQDPEEIENELAFLDEKLTAAVTHISSDELLRSLRRDVASHLAAYRGKMNAIQVAALEKQLLKKRLLDYFHLPRLSLFYL